MSAHRILVSSPLYLEPPQDNWANAFERAGRLLYEEDPNAFRQGCLQEHQAKVDYIENNALGSVIHIQPNAHIPESVFTRDGSINFRVKKNGESRPISVLANFTNPYRQHEAKAHRTALEALDPGVRSIHQCPFALEGGDIKLDPVRKMIWGGFHPNPSAETSEHGRTAIQSHAFISEIAALPVCSLETSKPFYHLDTFLGVAPRGELVVCFEGINKNNRDKIMENGFEKHDLDPQDYLIEVSTEEADRFATNFLGLNGQHIIMPEGNPRLAAIFRERGYNVGELTMRYIGASGGSSHCGTNDIDVEIDTETAPTAQSVDEAEPILSTLQPAYG